MQMKCTKSLVYGGKRYRPGDIFEARSTNDVRVLTAIKKAELVAAPAPEPVVVKPEPVVNADVPPSGDVAPVLERPKRAYRRRDLVAEKESPAE